MTTFASGNTLLMVRWATSRSCPPPSQLEQYFKVKFIPALLEAVLVLIPMNGSFFFWLEVPDYSGWITQNPDL